MSQTAALRESEPLLQHPQPKAYGNESITSDVSDAETAIPTKDSRDNRGQQLGLLSVVSLIFNRIIGTGVFAAPSVILRSSGSVGLTFVMWIIGALVSAAGTAVYVEFGTGLPRSGGEKTYLEYIYRRPAFLMSCIYASYGILLGQVPAASIAFGGYALHALGYEETAANVRIVACLCITLCLVVHGVFPTVGIKLQDTLGVFKLLVLLLISASGLFSLVGVPGFSVGEAYSQPHNFRWSTFWEGSNMSANAFTNGVYLVIWSFIGYSNANYALSEVRNPVRTIRRAGSLAMSLVSIVYILVNIAYYAVVSKEDILDSGTIAAALFFRNLFGLATERVLSVVIALSMLGNILAVLFAQGRVNQELGREGILPCSQLLASNEPFDAPLFGLFVQSMVSILMVLLTPAGDAYTFVVNFASYPLALFNLLISGGLLLLYTRPYKSFNWDPPFRAPKYVVTFFFLSNVFLVVVPIIPPSNGFEIYEHLPYYSHVVMSLMIGVVGVIYWFFCFDYFPRKSGYALKQDTIIETNGRTRQVIRRIPKYPE
ncbi:APC amino acid permease [Pisolithus croceorrhizus]|nr:APC amino acid permease [Pisolithus croceorrhizus]